MRGRLGSPVSAAFIRNALFLGMVTLSLASLLFTSQITARLEDQTATFTDLVARFAAASTLPASQDDEVQHVFRGFVDRVNFPIVVTDRRGVPLTCKRIRVSPDLITYELFITTDPTNPPPGPMDELLRLVSEMDLERTPIPIVQSSTGELFGHVHYGESPLAAQLRLMPFLQIGIAGLLVAFGYFGMRSIRTSEKRSIWVGMAKETAHQLGTPISSLMGWVDLLEAETAPDDKERRGTLDEMRADIDRLGKIANRFERVGSIPKLVPLDVNEIIRDVVVYLRRRLPSRGRRVEILEQLEEGLPPVPTDPELLSWTVENLLKNAADAILKSRKDGTIAVRTTHGNPSGVRIVVEDDGPGIPESIQNRIFDPGFTTKTRGWGLGLALARRIVEDYHGGRIRLLRSTPGVRTVFSVDLPEVPRAGHLPPEEKNG
ncbi:MAG: two-component sensor histidine kinase [Gemmatimonadota bacterium]|nr:MAG: two-component sensor histidine kinase [Gemmatimonadota bacterium]